MINEYIKLSLYYRKILKLHCDYARLHDYARQIKLLKNLINIYETQQNL